MLKHSKIALMALFLLLGSGSVVLAQEESIDAAGLPINAGPMKPLLTGLISIGRGGYNPAINENASYIGVPSNSLDDIKAKRNAFDGVIINVAWKELEPTPDQPVNSASIQSALEEIRKYNADPQTTVPLRAILRVYAGPNAPDWVKNLDGQPIKVAMNGPGGGLVPITIAHFWSRNYQMAWRKLQEELARRFDSEPLISEITNTSCTSTDDEWPALAWVGDKKLGISSINNLHAAGFNDAAFKNCLIHASEDYNGWTTTYVLSNLGFFRPTDTIKDYEVPAKDYVFPQEIMERWKRKFGVRAVFTNQTLNFPPEENAIPVYAYMKNAGVPLEFQTHSPHTLDWHGAILEAVCLGGNAVELWNSTPAGGYVDQSLSDLMAWSQQLKTTTTNELCPILAEKFGL